MDDKEIRERTRHLVARMLATLPVDRVVKILADAEWSYRLKAFPGFPKEIARRDTTQDPFHRMEGFSDKVVEGFKQLAEDLTDMWLADNRLPR